MKFVPTSDQQDFVASLEALLGSTDAVGAARAWAEGDTGPGRSLWSRLAEQGVHSLVVPEESGGLGATPVELVLALEVLGRHAVPGPWVESVAFLPLALPPGPALEALAEGAVGTVAIAPWSPRALDGDVADQVYVVHDGALTPATAGVLHRSIDGTRRLTDVAPSGDPVGPVDDAATDLAVLATAAQLLGLGEHLLAASVDYVKQRRQFGREIGSYQAIKHQLADVRIALDFVRPLVHGAAVGFDAPTRARDVSAAKVAAAEAAYLASRTGLQVHGAIGYTRELDLSLWITKVRALQSAWGTTAAHRARILDALVGA